MFIYVLWSLMLQFGITHLNVHTIFYYSLKISYIFKELDVGSSVWKMLKRTFYELDILVLLFLHKLEK
jgi:hypothetical protein